MTEPMDRPLTIFDDLEQWKAQFEGVMEPEATRAKVEQAEADAERVHVRWCNRAYAGLVSDITDEGFLLTEYDEGHPIDRVFCTWDATVAVTDTYAELPPEAAYTAMEEQRKRREEEAAAQEVQAQIASDLELFGVAYVMDGRRVDPEQVTAYYPDPEPDSGAS